MTTVFIYVDTSKQVGDLDHLKVFIDEATADTWLSENDPEGIRISRKSRLEIVADDQCGFNG